MMTSLIQEIQNKVESCGNQEQVFLVRIQLQEAAQNFQVCMTKSSLYYSNLCDFLNYGLSNYLFVF